MSRMNLLRTGRILDWFVRDLRNLRDRGDVRFDVLNLSADPYRPSGVWCFTQPCLDAPRLFCFPQPLHPIEAIAAVRGFGGLHHERDHKNSDPVLALAVARAQSWRAYTGTLSQYLFVTPESLRLVWHLLTPLNIPWYDENRLNEETDALWNAALPRAGIEWIVHLMDYRWPDTRELAPRPAFFTEEVTGTVEL
jgi:hypothetical protein